MKMTLDMSDLILSVSKPIVDDLRRASSHGRVLEICNGYDYPEVYDCCSRSVYDDVSWQILSGHSSRQSVWAHMSS